MTDSSVTIVVSLDRHLHEALLQLSTTMSRSVEDLAREAIAAAIVIPMELDLETLGTGLLDVVENYQPPDVCVSVSNEALERSKALLLPTDLAELVLGEDLIQSLTGRAKDMAPSTESTERLEAVAGVCAVLKGTRSETGIRRWWNKRRFKLEGSSPADFLGGAWKPDELAFRLVVELAESDAEFSAT